MPIQTGILPAGSTLTVDCSIGETATISYQDGDIGVFDNGQTKTTDRTIGPCANDVAYSIYYTGLPKVFTTAAGGAITTIGLPLPDPATLGAGASVVVGGVLVTVDDNDYLPIATRGHKFTLGLVGDSLVGRNINAWDIVPASCSQVAGVGTVTLVGTPDAPIGTRFTMHGWNDPLWNGEFVVSGHTSSTVVTFAISSNASSAPSFSSHNPQAQFANKYPDRSWYQFARMLSGFDFTLEAFAGRGSRTSTQVLTDFDKLVIAKRPRVVVLETPANDAKNGLTVSTTVSNMQLMCQKCILAGIIPVLCTTTPYGSSFYTAARLKTQLEVNRQLRAYAASSGVLLWDWHKRIVDPTSATGYPKSGWLDTDNIHLTPTSALALGGDLADILKGLGFYTKVRGLDSVAEPTNKCTNSALAGTGGALVGGVTGVAASSTIVTAVTSTVVASKGTKGGTGASQIVALSGSAGAAAIEFGTAAIGTIAGGSELYACMKVDITTSAPIRIKASLDFNSDNGAAQSVQGLMNYANTAMIPAGTYSFVIPFPKFTVPTVNPFTSIKLQLVAYMDTAAATATIEVYEPVLFAE